MAFTYSKTNLPTKLFINNEYVDSKSGKKLNLNNPRDQALVSNNIPLAGAEDVEAAVAAAEIAFKAWKKIGASQRRNMMLKFADLIEKHVESLAELTRITLGAPYESFGKFEANMAAEVFGSINKVRIDANSKRLSDITQVGLISLEESHGLQRTAL
jgi:aldehyde dehydrogenase (NAD+)